MGIQRQETGIVIAVLSTIAFAGSGPFVKPLLLEGWASGTAVAVRMGVAAVLLLPFAIASTRRDPGVWRRHWRWLLAYGLIAVAATQLLYYSAISHLDVSLALLIQFLAPVLLLLADWARTRRRPAAIALAGAALCLAGLVLALDPFRDGAVASPLGLALAGLGAIAVSGYFVMAGTAPPGLPATALLAAGFAIGAAAVAALGLAGVIPWRFEAVDVMLFGAAVPWWAPMIVVVLVGTIGGYLGVIVAARSIGVRLMSFIGLLEVVSAIALASVLLGEVPTPMLLVGGALIIGGVVLIRADRAAGSPVAEAVPAPPRRPLRWRAATRAGAASRAERR